MSHLGQEQAVRFMYSCLLSLSVVGEWESLQQHRVNNLSSLTRVVFFRGLHYINSYNATVLFMLLTNIHIRPHMNLNVHIQSST